MNETTGKPVATTCRLYALICVACVVWQTSCAAPVVEVVERYEIRVAPDGGIEAVLVDQKEKEKGEDGDE